VKTGFALIFSKRVIASIYETLIGEPFSYLSRFWLSFLISFVY